MQSGTVYVVLVIFAATLIRSVLGFGEALVAVPLLALVLPVTVAAPLAVLISITVALAIVLQDWHHVDFRSAGWLLAATVIGIPIGILLLTHTNQRIVKAILGGVILVFALHALVRRQLRELHDKHRAPILISGFLAGVLGGAYGMNGPPLAFYGALRRWNAQRFRATLQGYFLPASILGMIGYWFAGLWTAQVNRYFVLCLPLALAAMALGGIVNRRLHPDRFTRYVHAGLAVIGAVLIVQAARG
jgi:uncharacterized membrane protein YfcA